MSAALSNATVIYFRNAAARAMTWADIEADRLARGLDAPTAPKRKPTAGRSPKPQGPKRVTIGGLEIDARDPRNTSPHVAAIYMGPAPKTPAAAAKIRRGQMEACACRLCALALNPPTTFAEHRALCGQILDEHMEREVFGAPRVLRGPADPSRERLAAKREDTAEQLIHGPRGVTDPWTNAEREDRGNEWEWTGNMWRPTSK